jgi:hypothetical protein
MGKNRYKKQENEQKTVLQMIASARQGNFFVASMKMISVVLFLKTPNVYFCIH